MSILSEAVRDLLSQAPSHQVYRQLFGNLKQQIPSNAVNCLPVRLHNDRNVNDRLKNERRICI